MPTIVIWLLSHLRLVAFGGLAIFGFLAGIYATRAWDTADIAAIQEKAANEKIAAIEAAQKQCQDNQLITQGASDEYQHQISALNARVDALRVRLKAHSPCVPVTSAASRPDAGTGAGSAQQCGIDAGDLLTIAEHCEHDRAQLKALQGFVRKTWAAQAR